ncbi:ABC transporter permease [Acetobacter thailandicus]|uniref:ABC transporter permease n=1 Tax=Acetobacter thailandicus TaxID=1502842 RepID=UPI001BA837DB|nr:ABC transporter permease [Acetobacter thailandicus]MBS0960016.1 ABC transporter permease [Acetobacter thailandicus]MBS0985549.1 ABC transporter permease [Acetobacter thailandicus]
MSGGESKLPAQGGGDENDAILSDSIQMHQKQGLLLRLFLWLVKKTGALGRLVRHQVWFFLVMLGACWGVLFESISQNAWRRTVRYEFGTTMNSVIGGGLIATLFAGTLTGVAAVSQTIYWLGVAGMAKMTGSILINVVVREIAPILVGILLLGRNGMLSVTELGLLTTGGQIRSFQAQGIDPFLLLVMPRTLAFTVAGFTLGIVFSIASLLTGYIISRVSGVVTSPVWSFFNDVISAMSTADYIMIPLKFVTVGFVVGVGSCITGLTATSQDNLRTLLPRGFSRGMLIVMAVSVLFSLDF